MCTGTALLFVVCYIVIPTIVIVHCYFDHCALLFIQCMNLFLTILSCPSSDSKVERAEYRCNWRYEFPTVTLGRGTLSRIQPVITHTCVRLMQSRAHFMQGREHWIRMQGRARWMLGRAHWMVGRVRLMPGRARDAGPRALDALHRALDARCAGCRACRFNLCAWPHRICTTVGKLRSDRGRRRARPKIPDDARVRAVRAKLRHQ